MEIITINAGDNPLYGQVPSIPSGQESTGSIRNRFLQQVKDSWCSDDIYAHVSEELERPLMKCNYWAALYMRGSNPVIFKLRESWNGSQTKWKLENTLARIGVMIEQGQISGDVVFYRSSSPTITTSKYPLCNNGVYAIFTGNPEWIVNSESSIRWRSHTDELHADYEQFRNNFTLYEKLFPTAGWNGSDARRWRRQMRSFSGQQEHFNMRVAYVWSMLTDERPVSWDAILDSCSGPQRAGLLLWKEGKVRLWWHHSNVIDEPQHQMLCAASPWPASTFENSGLDIDSSGRFVEAND